MAPSAQSRQPLSLPRRALLRWRAWRRHHSQSAADSLGRVLAQPVASLLSWLVIGIAIALPAGLWLVLDNLASVAGELQRPAQLSVFLDAAVTAGEAQELTLELAARDDIETAQFIDRDAALQEFAAQSDMGELLARLPANPLPHLVLLVPASDDPALLAPLRDELLARPEVDELVLDTLWLQRLQAIMQLGRRAVQVLAVLSLAAVVLVLGNTIRLAIESRRDEIVIVKLVGGSDAFVRRPLLYTGLWYGLGGGLMAALLVLVALLILSVPVAQLAEAYQSSFTLRGPGLVDSLQLIMLGGLLGLAGAWLAVARHLSDIEPR
jgi:cell division transport system permease protein